MPLLHRQMLDVLGVKNAHKLIPMPEDMLPVDPVTENQNILMMKPVKAFAYQDHQAHITVHMSAMQDPKIQQLLQGNPQAQALQQAMMAHINEHLGFQYRVEIEKQLGIKSSHDVRALGIAQYNAECRKIVLRYARDWEAVVWRATSRSTTAAWAWWRCCSSRKFCCFLSGEFSSWKPCR